MHRLVILRCIYSCCCCCTPDASTNGMTQFNSNLWSLSMLQLRALGFLYKRTIVHTLLLHCCFTATEYQAGLVRINFRISWIRCCGYYLSCCSILCRYYLSVIFISFERSCRPFSQLATYAPTIQLPYFYK